MGSSIGFAFALLAMPAFAAPGGAASSDQPASARPIDADGTVNATPYRLPPSVYLSPDAQAALPREPEDYGPLIERLIRSGEIPKMRAEMSAGAAGDVATLAKKYRVQTEAGKLGGVSVVWARPEQVNAALRGKVLVNLPGGAFLIGDAASIGMKESIPLAGLSGIPIVSVNYRQAPEATFPAASEDVANVYRELLRHYRAEDIGIFGCSAGGILTAQSLAWFQTNGLPRPAAAGIFCASGDARWAGDSWFWQKSLQGLTTPPALDERFYYGSHDLDDPLMSPIGSDAVLARFPPTLIITGTRASELSSAVNTHRLLVRNGVEADLHVWDGLGHAFYLNESLPESREAFAVMTRFFTRRLVAADQDHN